VTTCIIVNKAHFDQLPRPPICCSCTWTCEKIILYN